MLPLQGAWVHSLVNELSSHMPWGNSAHRLHQKDLTCSHTTTEKHNKQTNKNSHTITKTPHASTKNWCSQIKKRKKLTHFLPHNFCGSGDGTWLTWALYCGVSHEAANEVSICQGRVSEAPGGKDPLPSSCGCWQDLVPHRLPD